MKRDMNEQVTRKVFYGSAIIFWFLFIFGGVILGVIYWLLRRETITKTRAEWDKPSGFVAWLFGDT